MPIVDVAFEKPTDEGFLFSPAASAGKSRWYHGTSSYFSTQIEQFGFVQRHSYIDSTAIVLLQDLAASMPDIRGPLARLSEPRPGFSFAKDARASLGYATNPLKGGIYRTINASVQALLRSPPEVVSKEQLAILRELSERLSGIPDTPGVLYALEFSAEDLKTFADSGTNIVDAYVDVPASRISHKVCVPALFCDG